MNLKTNPWTKGNFGAPPSLHGALGMWLNNRKFQTSAFVPSRWDRLNIRGWIPYWLTIPSTSPGLWQVGSQDTLEFQAISPVYFMAVGMMVTSQQPEGALVELYDSERNQALINPSGPALNLANLGGDGKYPFYFRKIFPLEPGTSILADITNLSNVTNGGQIILLGFEPSGPGLFSNTAQD